MRTFFLNNKCRKNVREQKRRAAGTHSTEIRLEKTAATTAPITGPMR